MVDGSRDLASALAFLNQQRRHYLPDQDTSDSSISRGAKAYQMLAADPSILNMSSFSEATSIMTQGALTLPKSLQKHITHTFQSIQNNIM